MIRYLTLAEYLWLAEEVTGVEARTLIEVARIELAESALRAPAAEFAGTEFYPERHEKAAILVSRLARNHPLPDGNKRAAWLSLAMFVELNGGKWSPDPPQVDEAEQFMLAVAAGDVDESWIVDWLMQRVSFA